MSRKTFSATFRSHAKNSGAPLFDPAIKTSAVTIVAHAVPRAPVLLLLAVTGGLGPLRILLGATALAPVVAPLFSGLLALGGFATLSACGTNVARPYAPADDAEEGERQMEGGHYAAAQTVLERHLAAYPEAHASRSLLAAACAAQGGVVLLDVILAATKNQQNGTSRASEIAAISSLLPNASLTNLAWLARANAEMAKIPDVLLTPSMATQGSLFLLFDSVLRIGFLRANPTVLAALTNTDAAKLLANLERSAALAALAGGTGNPFAEQTTKIVAGAKASPGEGASQKLGNYVARISQ